ncbi:MAG: hypothetical protein HW421_3593 [Ignavibacteria bacterium]|nr:hypothetical protein [Ignavibacteria bacterium]
MKKFFVSFVILLLILALSCTDDNPIQPNSNSKPQIISFKPSKAFPGDTITITGKNFGKSVGKIKVIFFDYQPAACDSIIFSDSVSKIICRVPEFAQTGKIVVSTDNGSDTSAQQIKIVEVPNGIVKITYYPKSAHYGEVIVIEGENFCSEKELNFIWFGANEAVCDSVDAKSTPMKLFVRVIFSTLTTKKHNQQLLSYTCAITVKVRNYAYTTNSDFTLLESNHKITGFFPMQGVYGTKVNIYGSGFGTDKSKISVYFGERNTNILGNCDTLITAYVPMISNDEKITVYYKNEGAVSEEKFHYNPAPAEFIGFSPENGPSGSEITLTFKNIPDDTTLFKLFLKNKPQINLSIISIKNYSDYQEITVKMPKVENDDYFVFRYNMNTKQASKIFRVTNPVITKISPTQGCATSPVYIEGNNFTWQNKSVNVYLGNTRLNIDSASPSKIKVRLPSVIGSDYFKLEFFGYNYQDATKITIGSPVITSLSKYNGKFGDEININGSFFHTEKDSNKVRFNGRQAKVTYSDFSKIKAIVPNDATKGFVEVQAAGKNAKSPSMFTIYFFIIDSVRPYKVKPSDYAYIYGKQLTNYGKPGKVKLGTTEVTIASYTDDIIKFQIPLTTSNNTYSVTLESDSCQEVSKDQIKVSNRMFESGYISLGGFNVKTSDYYEEGFSGQRKSTSSTITEKFKFNSYIVDNSLIEQIVPNYSCMYCYQWKSQYAINFCEFLGDYRYENDGSRFGSCTTITIEIIIDSIKKIIDTIYYSSNYQYHWWNGLSHYKDNTKSLIFTIANVPYFVNSNGNISSKILVTSLNKDFVKFINSESSYYYEHSGYIIKSSRNFVNFESYPADSYFELTLYP